MVQNVNPAMKDVINVLKPLFVRNVMRDGTWMEKHVFPVRFLVRLVSMLQDVYLV